MSKNDTPTEKKRRRLSTVRIMAKLRQVIRYQERAKILYAKADALLARAGESAKAGEIFDIGDEKLYVIEDQFEGAELVWAHAAARRWKLKELSRRTSEAITKSLEKGA